VDQYWIGTTRGLSAEAPIPIIDIKDSCLCPGGSTNVLKNLLALCGTNLSSVIWTSVTDGCPIKHRLITENNRQLARWDEENFCEPIKIEEFQDLDLSKVEAIVVSDYGKGSITPALVAWLVSLDKPLFVDTKADPIIWLGANDIVLFPNYSEYEKARSTYEWFPRVLLKRGPDGLAWVQYGKVIFSLPSVTQDVVCVNGAGDTVLAAFVKAQIIDKASILSAMKFANYAAGVAVGKPYTYIVTVEDMVPSSFISSY
jgi:bifunctional ADP-heptose synthase (sugar kinase/adenylyltransferase)